jgi:glycerate kinase
MKVVIAPDSFKGSLSAIDVSLALREGVLSVYPKAEVVLLPIADGGEGTMSTLAMNQEAVWKNVLVHDPLFGEMIGNYVTLDSGLCIIEIAEASGLTLLSETERNPMNTSTIGTGELLLDAFNRGSKEFIIGLGGSATNDCGLGVLYAFGYRFFDSKGNDLSPIGGNLIKIRRISDEFVNKKTSAIDLCLAVDVTNPLFGDSGAAFVYGEQKGGSFDQLMELDSGVRNFHAVTSIFLGKEIDANTSGFGAAGGVAFSLVAFFNARIVSGIELVADKVGLKDQIESADLVISGEGKVDLQTLQGKAISGVSKITNDANKPLVLVGGEVQLSPEELNDFGITAAFSISNKPMSLEKAMKKETVKKNLTFIGSQLTRLFVVK